MAITISHLFKIEDVAAGSGQGLEIDTITAQIANRDRVNQATLGPAILGGGFPTWLVQTTGAPDYTYTLTQILDDTTLDVQSDFVLMTVSGIIVGGATFAEAFVVPFTAASTPTGPDGRESYLTLAEADAYFATELEGEEWFAFSERQRTLALIKGSDDIDTEKYKGRKLAFPDALASQTTTGKWRNRQWPRFLDEYSFDANFEGDMPLAIQHASAIQALHRLRILRVRGDAHARLNLMMGGVTGQSQGRASENWDLASMPNDVICAEARILINPHLITAAGMGYFD